MRAAAAPRRERGCARRCRRCRGRAVARARRRRALDAAGRSCSACRSCCARSSRRSPISRRRPTSPSTSSIRARSSGTTSSGAREGARARVDPLPLALWGRAVRDTLGALVERTGGDLDDAFVERRAARPRASALLADVLQRRLPSGGGVDEPAGVRVLACPDPRREIEIVAAEIRARLDADPTLHAREIGVWIASNAERYLAQAPAAFEAVGVPCHLIDAPIDDRGRIGEAVLALLELPTGAMTRRDLLRVMTHPAVLAAHPHVDRRRLGALDREARHRARRRSRARTRTRTSRIIPGHFHWDQGVRRLALGAFMIGGATRSSAAPVRIGGIDVAPEEVRPEKHASAATYALLVRSLCADARVARAARGDARPSGPTCSSRSSTRTSRGRRRGDARRRARARRCSPVSRTSISTAGASGFARRASTRARRLESARANRGEPLAAGVMIAPLAAMRALPFRDRVRRRSRRGRVPRRRSAEPARRAPRAARRRCLAARSRSPRVPRGAARRARRAVPVVRRRRGEERPGARAVVGRARARRCARAVSRRASRATRALAQLTTRYPLHRFGAATRGLPPAIARERWAVRVRDALRAHLRANGHPVPDEDGMLALLAHPSLARAARRARHRRGADRAAAGAADRGRSRSRTCARSSRRRSRRGRRRCSASTSSPTTRSLEHSDEPFHVDAAAARAAAARGARGAAARSGRECRGALPRRSCATSSCAASSRSACSARPRARAICACSRVARELGRSRLVGDAARAVGRRPARVRPRRRRRWPSCMPALELALPGGRTVRLVGQTELLLRDGERLHVGRPADRQAPTRSRAITCAARSITSCSPRPGSRRAATRTCCSITTATMREVEHAPWSQADARAYLDDARRRAARPAARLPAAVRSPRQRARRQGARPHSRRRDHDAARLRPDHAHRRPRRHRRMPATIARAPARPARRAHDAATTRLGGGES